MTAPRPTRRRLPAPRPSTAARAAAHRSSPSCAAGCTSACSRPCSSPGWCSSRSPTAPRGRIACAIYTLTACLLFGVSALYHRGNWGPRANAVLRRLDHANIFLIIAGTYTPLTMLLLPGRHGAAAAVGRLGGSAGRYRLPGLLGRRPALALHALLHRDGLGRRLLPARLPARPAAIAVLVLRHRRRPALQRGRRRSTASSAPTPHPAGSASTRCSTPSRWPRSSSTTWASHWWPTSTRSPHGVGADHGGCLRRRCGSDR